jgi:hypothetical protein
MRDRLWQEDSSFLGMKMVTRGRTYNANEGIALPPNL